MNCLKNHPKVEDAEENRRRKDSRLDGDAERNEKKNLSTVPTEEFILVDTASMGNRITGEENRFARIATTFSLPVK